MKIINKILWGLVYALPAVLFFSYYPILSFGSNSSMNFELSLPLIWLVIFDLFSFIWLIGYGIFQSKNPSPAHSKNTPLAQSANLSPAKSKNHKTSSAQPQTASHLNTNRLRTFFTAKHRTGISDRRFFLLSLVPLYFTISALWSGNLVRGILTAGVIWAVFFAVFALLFILPLGGVPTKLRRNVLISLFASSVLVCVFCYLQSILDVAGVDRQNTLLCLGCTYRSFGFPHPSGFAIEPQFMGNLLLAPTLTVIYLIIFGNPISPKNTQTSKTAQLNHSSQAFRSKLQACNWQTLALWLLASFLSTTLFFIFSRGAIYAYVIALVVLLIFALKRQKFRWSLIIIPIASFLCSLVLQGTFAALGPTPETFGSAIAKSIHQLSLGIIDFRQPATPDQAESPVENSTTSVENIAINCGKHVENYPQNVENTDNSVQNSVQNHQNGTCTKPIDAPVSLDIELLPIGATTPKPAMDETGNDEAIFSGYVAESTNIRLNLNKAAFETWLAAPGHDSIDFGCPDQTNDQIPCEPSLRLAPTSILFGVGLGGAGTAMHEAFPDIVTSPKEIVQHEGFSLLLETGLVGIGLVIFGLLVAFFPQIFTKKFLDGRDATSTSTLPTFWQHPALPLLVSLILAYLITLNFFSGLPNALQIYLMPPLLFLIFQNPANPVGSKQGKSK